MASHNAWSLTPAGSKCIIPADFAWRERQLFNELKRRVRARIDCSGPPIGDRCLDCLMSV